MGGAFHRLSLWNFKTSATFYDTAYEIWPYRRMWSFHLHSMVKIRLFFPLFLLADAVAETFSLATSWIFKKESISHFL